MLRVHYSNRIEILAEKLAERLAGPGPDPMARDVVVVQSKGMERWVAMELARLSGVCANVEFPFPVGLVYRLFQDVLGDVPDESPFAQPVMAWRVMRLLPGLLAEPEFAPLARYCEAGERANRAMRRLQLAQQIAFLFDQYLIFRPELILAWERGEAGGLGGVPDPVREAVREAEHWQARLWRELARGHEHLHRAALKERFHAALASAAVPGAHLPARLGIFGVSSLPPYYLEVLADLSRHIPVDLYYLNPCREYWFDIASRKEAARRARSADTSSEVADMAPEEGNALLASLGALGRGFLETLYDRDLADEAPPLWVGSGAQTLLGRIQDDILALVQREPHAARRAVAADDSVQIHCCHGPGREMEVVRDLVLDALDRDPALTPRDVLVMTPDIETYAPYVQAVFGATGAGMGADRPGPPMIPYSIADRAGIAQACDAASALLELLALAGSRLEASRVLALLEHPLVRACFGLSETDVETAREWVLATGIRWGRDAADREAAGLPAFREGSWASGLERLLLGYAMDAAGGLYDAILPLAVEGDRARVLGGLLEFVRVLFGAVRALREPRPPQAWRELLLGLVDALLAAPGRGDDGEAELAALRRTLHELAREAELAAYADPVGVEEVAHILSGKLLEADSARGFLAGGVTFCSLVPMRSIPFKLVILSGMDSETFPRRDRASGFDLMAAAPRRGDRSARTDDRQLFLEALLSARERLVVTYVGRDARDNAVRPPSTLVEELKDYIRDNYVLAGTLPEDAEGGPQGDLVDAITRVHRLQAFHPDYFSGGALFSYSAQDCAGAAALDGMRESAPPAPFIESLPPETDTDGTRADGAADREESLALADLLDYFAHPARHLLSRRLGLRLNLGAELVEDCEPMGAFGALERYGLGSELVAARTARLDLLDPPDGALEQEDRIRAENRVPPGEVGRIALAELGAQASAFARAVHGLGGARSEPRAGEWRVGGVRLGGQLGGLYAHGLVRHRFAAIKGTDVVRAWIEHLFLQHWGEGATLLAGWKNRSQGTLDVRRFGPVDDAAGHLERLIALRREGLVRPLPFAPGAAWALAQKADDVERGLADARRVWEGFSTRTGERIPGEGEDAWVRQCHGRADLVGETRFAELALAVFGPALEHMEEVRP